MNTLSSQHLFAAAYSKATGVLPANTSSLLDSFRANGTVSSIEKHLDDYEKGRGKISKAVSVEIGRKQRSASNLLAGMNPGAFQDYNGYLSTLSYSSRARFVDGVNDAAQTLSRIVA